MSRHRGKVRPSPHDVLARHQDFDQLIDPGRKVPEVVTHKGWADPTPRQLAYIARLANETNRRVPDVRTKQGAQAAIAALLRRRDALRSLKETSGAKSGSGSPASAD